MFCPNCGAEVPNGSGFCPNCGTGIQPVSVNTVPVAKKSNKKIIGIAVVACVVTFVIAFVAVFSGGGYKKAIRKYFRAIETQNPNTMYALAPDYWKDYMQADSTYSESELIEIMEEHIEDVIDEYGCGNKIKISYRIQRTYSPTKSEIKDLEDNMFDWYAYYVYDRSDFKIKDAKLVYLEVTVKGNGKTEKFTYPRGFLVFKEKGNWKVIFGSVSTGWYSNQ